MNRMADMTLCPAKNCKDKHKCFRYVNLGNADPLYQSFADPSMTEEMDRFKCSMFSYTKQSLADDIQMLCANYRVSKDEATSAMIHCEYDVLKASDYLEGSLGK